MMDMIYPGNFEQSLKEHERKLGKVNIPTEQQTEYKKVISDVSNVLTQFGYGQGAEVLKRMTNGEEK